MIIFNTTYCVDLNVHDRCMIWLRDKYIPQALQSGQLHSPKMSKILTQDSDGVNYALQFKVETVDVLEIWYQNIGDDLQQELSNHFGESVLSFSTLMEEVDI